MRRAFSFLTSVMFVYTEHEWSCEMISCVSRGAAFCYINRLVHCVLRLSLCGSTHTTLINLTSSVFMCGSLTVWKWLRLWAHQALSFHLAVSINNVPKNHLIIKLTSHGSVRFLNSLWLWYSTEQIVRLSSSLLLIVFRLVGSQGLTPDPDHQVH